MYGKPRGAVIARTSTAGDADARPALSIRDVTASVVFGLTMRIRI
jgi:hypothetical protein